MWWADMTLVVDWPGGQSIDRITGMIGSTER
jgi:hypothetical protein